MSASETNVPGALGRVVATERKPNTPHEFHFWTALDSPVGIGTIVRVDGDQAVNGQLPRIYGIVERGGALVAGLLLPVPPLALPDGNLKELSLEQLAQFEAVTISHLGAQRERYGRIRLWGSLGFMLAVSGLGAAFDGELESAGAFIIRYRLPPASCEPCTRNAVVVSNHASRNDAT